MMRVFLLAACALSTLAACQPPSSPPSPTAAPVAADYSQFIAEPRTLEQLTADLASGATTSEKLTQFYLDRIAAVDDSGPMLNAVIALNPDALAHARELDARRAAGTLLGPLHGVPVLIKDNIETLDEMATTAGSLALKDNITHRDAPLVARLRAGGAVILGKTNLSEWANFRSDASTSGWSAAGGLTRNPHALDRNTCGSSSGSGAAVAAGLAPLAIGTETDGSIMCPAHANGVVGIKPTVGLVSRTHIIPISSSQDTAGPMALTVADAAAGLAAIAGADAADPATARASGRVADYASALDAGALAGKRIGIARFHAGYHAGVDAVFAAAIADIVAAGATAVEIADFPSDRAAMGRAEFAVLLAEFNAGLNAYLASAPPAVTVRSLRQLIDFNAATPAELQWFGQDTLQEAAAAPAVTDAGYLAAVATSRRLAGAEGIDRLLADHRLDAIIAPTGAPAWQSDLVNGDNFLGASSALAAVSGHPAITVPMGDVHGLPVGLTFMGPAWSEARLIGLAFAYEQRAKARLTPAFRVHIP
ncbi:MAG: amidase [Alphaproteobacteria bacterium]|nr:amidase [Alphaproteobacteria bacterium]